MSRSRVSEAIFRKFLRHVAADLTAVQIAQFYVCRLQPQPQQREPFLACLRERMAEQCELEHPFRGTVEVDESYFGPRRVASRQEQGWAWS